MVQKPQKGIFWKPLPNPRNGKKLRCPRNFKTQLGKKPSFGPPGVNQKIGRPRTFKFPGLRKVK